MEIADHGANHFASRRVMAGLYKSGHELDARVEPDHTRITLAAYGFGEPVGEWLHESLLLSHSPQNALMRGAGLACRRRRMCGPSHSHKSHAVIRVQSGLLRQASGVNRLRASR